MLRIASWIGAIFAAGFVLLVGEHLQPSQASAQNIPNPSCAKAGSDFACVGALDGTATQQIIVGNWGQTGGEAGYVIIIENTGAVRKRVCWVATSQGQPTCLNVVVQ